MDVHSLKSDLLLESSLKHNDIDVIFNTIISSENIKFKNGVFLSLKQGKTLYGYLPYLSPEVQNVISENGTCLSLLDKQSIISLFRETRNVFIISVLHEAVLVSKVDMLDLLETKIRRELENGNLIKRGIDCDIFMTLFVVNTCCSNDEREIESTGIIPLTEDSQDNGFNQPKNKNLCDYKSKEKTTRPIVPRPVHTTTVIGSEVVVYPFHKQTFNKPKYTDAEETEQIFPEDKFPTQVTEIDSGQPSIESRIPSKTVYNSEDKTNLYSVPTSLNDNRIRTGREVVTSSTRIPLIVKPPRYPDYAVHQIREESFNNSNWIVDSKPSRISLAECGFFYTGNNDLVRCYQCGIGLKDWIKEDDIMNEHVKYSSSCSFLQRKFGKHRIEQMQRALAQDKSENGIAKIDSNSPLQYKIRSPRYQTMEARVATFENFPKNISISHQQLAVAGLFYTGQGDLCRCFTCDGGLKDWSPGDDPIKEHATYFPKCSYILKLKGQEYVLRQQQGRQNSQPMGAEGGSKTPNLSVLTLPATLESMSQAGSDTEYSSFKVSQVVQQMGYAEIEVITAKAELEKRGNKFPTAEDVINTILDLQANTENSQHVSPSVENSNDITAMIQENKKLTGQMYCKLCVTEEADILFLPCTHHRVCHACAKDLIFCPVCNEFIKERVKTFRA